MTARVVNYIPKPEDATLEKLMARIDSKRIFHPTTMYALSVIALGIAIAYGAKCAWNYYSPALKGRIRSLFYNEEDLVRFSNEFIKATQPIPIMLSGIRNQPPERVIDFSEEFKDRLARSMHYVQEHQTELLSQSQYKFSVLKPSEIAPWTIAITPEKEIYIQYDKNPFVAEGTPQDGQFKKITSGFWPKKFKHVCIQDTEFSVKAIKAKDPEVLDDYANTVREGLTLLAVNDIPNAIHTYAVNYREAVVDGDLKWIQTIVQDYAMAGNLKKLFPHIKNNRILKEKIAKEVIWHFVCLHAKNLTHNDLKFANVVIDQFGNIKVIDYGFSRAIYEGSDILCSPMFTDLEIFLEMRKTGLAKKSGDPRNDIYSLGVLLYFLFAEEGKYNVDKDGELLLPWIPAGVANLSKNELIKVLIAQAKAFPEPRNNPWLHLAWLCMNPDPDKRPTIDKLYEMVSRLVTS